MARLARYGIPDQPQHVIQRGNNRGVTFVADADYGSYLDCLDDAAKQTGCDIHAYVLTTNHVHLLTTQHEAGGISRMMQSLGRRYVRHFNLAQRRSGTLWEGRYRATVIDGPQYLLACMRSIEMNPVRAGMVAGPADYPWSSHRVHAEGGASSLIVPHALYLGLGMTPELRQAAYRALFLDAQDESAITAIRDATQKGWALGNDRFKDEIARLTERRVEPAPRGRPRKQEAHDAAQRESDPVFPAWGTAAFDAGASWQTIYNARVAAGVNAPGCGVFISTPSRPTILISISSLPPGDGGDSTTLTENQRHVDDQGLQQGGIDRRNAPATLQNGLESRRRRPQRRSDGPSIWEMSVYWRMHKWATSS